MILSFERQIKKLERAAARRNQPGTTGVPKRVEQAIAELLATQTDEVLIGIVENTIDLADDPEYRRHMIERGLGDWL